MQWRLPVTHSPTEKTKIVAFAERAENPKRLTAPQIYVTSHFKIEYANNDGGVCSVGPSNSSHVADFPKFAQ